jgi:hypothetical protein
MGFLTRCLKDVSARIGAAESGKYASVATREIIGRIIKPDNPYNVPYYVSALTPLLRYLEATEAARHTSTVVNALNQAQTLFKDDRSLGSAIQAWRDMSEWMGAADATKVAKEITYRMIGPKVLGNQSDLAQAMRLVSTKLDRTDASAVVDVIIKQMAMSKMFRAEPLEGLNAVLARLEAGEAARRAAEAAELVIESVDKGGSIREGEGLGWLLALLEPAVANRYAEARARSISKAMDNANVYVRGLLAKRLALVSIWLEPKEAAKYAEASAAAVTEAMGGVPISTKDPAFSTSELASMLRGLEWVPARLGPREGVPYAFAAAEIITQAMVKDPRTEELKIEFRSLIAWMGVERESCRAVYLICAGTRIPCPWSLPCTLVAEEELTQSRLATQDLVELLKMPSCIGPARRVVLDHLGQRYRRSFKGKWEFVEFAERHLPIIDLKSPPKRPGK